jgi:signal transduction histidine kinase/ligand-binding sensor domain-containing protein
VKLRHLHRLLTSQTSLVRIALALLALSLWSPVYAQEYRLKQFRVEDGLPSNVIKAITQDSCGFFWIATDEGIVKFDGHTFTSYKDAMHSQYAKGFLRSHSGKLYVYGDLDLIEIDNKIDTVIFRSVLRGTRNPTDSTLWFPKTVFEDKDNNLWLSEPQSVVRLENGKLQRFNFGIEDRSPGFLRSFAFFEDRLGFLYAVSYAGNVYMFDSDEYTFMRESTLFPPQASDAKVIDNVLWMATEVGLYRADLLEQGGFSKPVRISEPVSASYLMQMNDSLSLLTTFDEEHYLVDLNKGTFEGLPFDINNVNSSYQSGENDIWLASNEGLILLQRNLFYPVKTPDQQTFTEAITEDRVTHVMYHCTMGNLYKITPGLSSNKILYLPSGYFQALAHGSKGLWAANAFSVYLIVNDKISRRWDFEADGRFIHDIIIDRSENVWLSQAGNSHVTSISPGLAVKRYPVPLKPESVVNCIREGAKGLYIASNGLEGYLFFKPNGDSVFTNISIPINFETHGDFNVTDIVATDSLLWLATSEGLIRYNGRTLQRLDLGDAYSNLPVKTVKILQPGYLLFNNSFGLFRYNMATNDFWRYDESNGLPSNTITARGIYVDDHRRVWIGTSVGVAVSNETLMLDRRTLSPRFTKVKVNGVEQMFTKGLNVPFGAFFTVNMSCISFPSDKIQIQYRIPSLDSAWKTLAVSELTLHDLPAGIYTIEARAKKNGSYVWSKTSSMEFTLLKPFWQQTWFIASVLMMAAFIAWSSFAFAGYINRKRRQQLETLVNQRTIELKKINEELSMRNSELDRFVYSTSHDLSAPLKSIRGLIMVAKMEETTPSQLSYLQMMERSVKKLEAFIADVINYSRNARSAVQHQPISFVQFIQQLLDDHQYAPNYDRISFVVEDHTTNIILSDEMRLKIIFNNLISNAIKFHVIEDGEQSFVKISVSEEADKFVFTVADNGIGINPEFKERIFDMFFRATDSVSGSGLGLYILRETVLKLGGDVQVQSQVGVGTTFIVVLPKQ